jgi:hypothetical protein
MFFVCKVSAKGQVKEILNFTFYRFSYYFKSYSGEILTKKAPIAFSGVSQC